LLCARKAEGSNELRHGEMSKYPLGGWGVSELPADGDPRKKRDSLIKREETKRRGTPTDSPMNQNGLFVLRGSGDRRVAGD